MDLIKATGASIKAGGRARTPSLRPCFFANKTIRSLEGEESQKARQWHWAKQKLEDLICANKEGSSRKTEELRQAITNNKPAWLVDTKLVGMLQEAVQQLGATSAAADDKAAEMATEGVESNTTGGAGEPQGEAQGDGGHGIETTARQPSPPSLVIETSACHDRTASRPGPSSEQPLGTMGCLPALGWSTWVSNPGLRMIGGAR